MTTEITFERAALYEAVWKTPLTRLAEKYGLSDNGLRKVCKALHIPLPPFGHWARVEAGHPVEKTPLPPTLDRTTFISRPTSQETTFHLPKDDVWLAERAAFEALAENRIVVESKPNRWHAAVATLRDDLREATKETEEAHRHAERTKGRKVWTEPDFKGAHWRSFLHSGQILLHTHRSMPMRVTPLTYERALLILNAFCYEAERRGFSATLDVKAGRILLKGHSAEIGVRLTERLSEEWRTEQSDWDPKPRRVAVKVPTGKLRMFVGERWSEAEIADANQHPLEERLNEGFLRVYAKVVRYREAERKNEAWQREWDAEERRREEAERRRRKEAAERQAEQRREADLVTEARNWKTAALIRDYVAHIERARPTRGGSASRLDSWTNWALEYAARLDPTGTRLAR